MMSQAMPADRAHMFSPRPGSDYPTSVLIVSTLLYGVFAFVVTIVALNIFWPAGLVLGMVLGWRGGFIPGLGDSGQTSEAVKSLRHDVPHADFQSSGNSSFDAYRTDMLTRLEKEQTNFESFLGRLRDAKDKDEFDTFMDERATRARPVSAHDAPGTTSQIDID